MGVNSICDKRIHKYGEWPGPCSTSLQVRPEVTEAPCLTACGAGLCPRAALLRTAFRAGMVFKRQWVVSLTKKMTRAKKNSVCQHSTHLHSACQVEAPIGGSGRSDSQVCAFNADAYVPTGLCMYWCFQISALNFIVPRWSMWKSNLEDYLQIGMCS